MQTIQTIIVVGRNNKARQSDTIRTIVNSLHTQGCMLQWFESNYSASYDRMTEWINHRWPSVGTSNCGRFQRLRRAARIILRMALVACDRHRRDHFYAMVHGTVANETRELGLLLDTMPMDSVALVTHSAGGVAATRIAAHPAITAIACFGYPFKHPDNPPEAYRTEHLVNVSKPLLVLQGSLDPYGNDPAHFGKSLPRSAQITMLDCDHDCDKLGHEEFERARSTLQDFFSQATGRPSE